jgi:ABC-type transport system substrate-binding protein
MIDAPNSPQPTGRATAAVRGIKMDRISRRQIVRAGGAMATSVALGARPVCAQKDLQTLRFVAEADLKVLDPIWTTAYITRNHGYLIYDTLFGTDEKGLVKPQMVDRTTVSPDGLSYTFTLRDGLRWHDGQPVISEDCVESLKRWGKKDRRSTSKPLRSRSPSTSAGCSRRSVSHRAMCPS